MLIKDIHYCACGCGEETLPGRMYIYQHHNIGKKASKESRQKMSKAHQGHYVSEKTKLAVSKAHKGKKLSVKHKEKIGAASKGLWKNALYRDKVVGSLIGRPCTEETKRKMSEASLGKPKSDEHRRKLSISHKGMHPTAETRQKMRRTWRNPEQKEKRLKAIFASFGHLPNKPERRLRSLLNKLFPGEYKYVGDGDVWIGGKNPDFVNVNGQKKVIEVFGSYWHGGKRTGMSNTAHRKERESHFAKYGYQTLVVWEHQLSNRDRLEKKLRMFNIL
jgi:G:T-mismatch repair DNA endonuclease (very short patch repair protein)